MALKVKEELDLELFCEPAILNYYVTRFPVVQFDDHTLYPVGGIDVCTYHAEGWLN